MASTQQPGEWNGLQCVECDAQLTGLQRKFCGDTCRNRHHRRLHYRRKKAKEGKDPTVLKHHSRPRRGKVYEDLKTLGLLDDLLADRATQEEAAREVDSNVSSVSRALAAYREELRLQAEATTWEPTSPPPPLDLDHLDDLVDHFCEFRATFFQTPDGGVYDTPPHQRRWIRAILNTYLTGGKLLILSPPRHGKTELLAHFDVWVIAVINPNVRILKVGGNQDIAANAVGMVRTQLDDNEQLQAAFLPPDKDYKPGHKMGMSWTNEKFTVATRTIPGIKSPTMVAVGRGGKILSRDADLIVADDIEDTESTGTESGREKTRNWWAITLMSRKEANTGMVVIGSRQHPDDLYNHLLDDPSWDKIVEQMHDEACEQPDDDPASHVDCMLWPEVRDYDYLLSLKNDPIIATQFEMVYQNRPQDSEIATFSRDDIDLCKNASRMIGEWPDHPSVRLIAGLDPAGSGYQASFLWAVDQRTGARYAVDLENRLGGGIERAREVIKRWFEEYQCRHWVIEENLYHGAFLRDEMLKDYCQQNAIHLEGHATYGNKWDPQLGVSVLATWMKKGLIDIPWGDNDTANKMGVYRRQLINFSRDTTKKNKTDVVMASWFPEERIQLWIKNYTEAQQQHTHVANYPFQTMDYAFSSYAW